MKAAPLPKARVVYAAGPSSRGKARARPEKESASKVQPMTFTSQPVSAFSP
jgi:hypothetical protein